MQGRARGRKGERKNVAETRQNRGPIIPKSQRNCRQPPYYTEIQRFALFTSHRRTSNPLAPFHCCFFFCSASGEVWAPCREHQPFRQSTLPFDPCFSGSDSVTFQGGDFYKFAQPPLETSRFVEPLIIS